MGRDMMDYNVHEGHLEAMVHGYRDALLHVDEYNNLCQCDNLGDMKSQLQVTDYGNFLQQWAGQPRAAYKVPPTRRLSGNADADRRLGRAGDVRGGAD